MSGILRPSLRCSGWASRCGRSIRCSSPNHPVLWRLDRPGVDAAMIRELPRRHRGARRARPMRRRDLGLYRRGPKSARPHPRQRGRGASGQPGRALLLRSGNRDVGRACSWRRDPRVPARPTRGRPRTWSTPNHFELDYLSGPRSTTLRDVHRALDAVHAPGPRVILVTSLHTSETPRRCGRLVASEATGRISACRTPRLRCPSRRGRTHRALFFAHHLRTASAPRQLARATSSVFGILRRHLEASARELLLIEAQDEIVAPSEVFQPESI